MRQYNYLDELGKMVEVEDCVKNHLHYEQAMAAREELIEKLADFDEEIADKYIMGEHISEQDLLNSIRFSLKNFDAVALHCGSALK